MIKILKKRVTEEIQRLKDALARNVILLVSIWSSSKLGIEVSSASTGILRAHCYTLFYKTVVFVSLLMLSSTRQLKVASQDSIFIVLRPALATLLSIKSRARV